MTGLCPNSVTLLLAERFTQRKLLCELAGVWNWCAFSTNKGVTNRGHVCFFILFYFIMVDQVLHLSSVKLSSESM